jgi:hypothetical protein
MRKAGASVDYYHRSRTHLSSTRIVRTRVRSSRRGTAEVSLCPKSAGCTIATSALRRDPSRCPLISFAANAAASTAFSFTQPPLGHLVTEAVSEDGVMSARRENRHNVSTPPAAVVLYHTFGRLDLKVRLPAVVILALGCRSCLDANINLHHGPQDGQARGPLQPHACPFCSSNDTASPAHSPLKARMKSSSRSRQCSVPTEIRTRSSVMPATASSAGLSSLGVVVIG